MACAIICGCSTVPTDLPASITGIYVLDRVTGHGPEVGTLVLTPDTDETARVTEFLSGMAGDAFGEQFTVGEPDDIVRGVEELVAAGVDTLIFNMPLSDPDTVEQAGELLVKNFA